MRFIIELITPELITAYDLDDPELSQQLAERLAGKVGDEMVLFATHMREGLLGVCDEEVGDLAVVRG